MAAQEVVVHPAPPGPDRQDVGPALGAPHRAPAQQGGIHVDEVGGIAKDAKDRRSSSCRGQKALAQIGPSDQGCDEGF